MCDWLLLTLILANGGLAAWSFILGRRFSRVNRLLIEICLGAWPHRGSPRLARAYIDTVGKWLLEEK